MPRPFELTAAQLAQRLDEMVDSTFGDLESQFLILPKGNGFIEYKDFQDGYEVLKRHTNGFKTVTEGTVWAALVEDGLTFVVLRTILGLSPPEWADLARSELESDVNQGVARGLDTKPRQDRHFYAKLKRNEASLSFKRAAALVKVAIDYIGRGAPAGAMDTVHRLAKVDTSDGLRSLRHVAGEHVPYAVLLYERYLGRPFASHRDSVSELVGDVMESAIEERLAKAGVTFRKTRRAERIEGFEQAPDFFAPTEYAPKVIIEAKITGDDGTARDKVARILRLATMRDDRARSGRPTFEVVACIDGRGFGVRRQDMRDMLTATKGKIFTLKTLDQLIPCTELQKLLPKETPGLALSDVARKVVNEVKQSLRFVQFLPVYSLKAAAGKFGDGRDVHEEGWLEVDLGRALTKDMFIAKVVGHSMEPKIPDSSYCVFTVYRGGSRQGKIVLAQHHDIADPEMGGSYTVKRYRSEKKTLKGESWRHTKIILESLNPDFKSIELSPASEDEFKIIAEFVAVAGQ